MNSDIIWEEFDNLIKTFKYPLSFIYSLWIKINNKSINITDDNLVLIIKFLFKYHSDIFILYDLRKLNNLLDNFKNSKDLISNLYFNFQEIIKTKNDIKKFKSIKNNTLIEDKIIKLKNIKLLFNSEYDLNYNIIPFSAKLSNLFENEKFINFHKNEIKYRLSRIYKLLGIKFFIDNNIILISKNDFFYLNKIDVIKYYSYIYQKISKILDKTINNYIYLHHLINKVEGYLNPVDITFEFNDISSEINSLDFL